MKRWNQKTALAFHFGCDVSDIEWYQNRGEKIKLFSSGLHYYCALPPNEAYPKGYAWEQMPDSLLENYGWRILRA